MIVPRNKLLLWAALILLPCALVVTAEPAAGWACAGVALLFAIGVGVDAWRAPKSIEGFRVDLAPVIRLFKDRASTLDLRLTRGERTPACVRVALDLPPGLETPEEEVSVALPSDPISSCFAWPIVPRSRGRFNLDSAYVELPSPLGLWGARARVPVTSELRVYPDLLEERRKLSGLFLHRGNFGLHAQRQLGKGREFEKLREYMPGDSFDEVHWKATARRGRPITKVFQVERTQEVYVVIDASRLSARRAGPVEDGAAGKRSTALERYVTAALILSLAAEQQGDLYGLAVLGDHVQRFVRASNGKSHYGACRDALYTVQAQNVTPDFEELCSFIRLRLRRRSLLVFLTALDDPVLAEGFVRSIEMLARQHLILVNMLHVPGVNPLFSGVKAESVDALYEHLGGHLRWAELSDLEKRLKHRGVRFFLTENENLSAALVSRYLAVKQQQLL